LIYQGAGYIIFFVKKGLSNKGLTLLELLIAAAIFAFAMSGILYMFINCAFFDQANRNKSIATTHAEFVLEDIMEYMRSSDLNLLQTGIASGVWNWDSSTISNELGCTGYPCVLNSELINTAYVSATDPLNITVTVRWKDRAQTNERNLTLETSISER
jgi:prepilin-type N-terminal cleavage/methylation domain-containing protein